MSTSSFSEFGMLGRFAYFCNRNHIVSRETVGSVGVIPKRLPFTTSNTHVKYFRHALALDEHRVRFKPNFWNRPTPDEIKLGVKRGDMPRPKPQSKTTRDYERQYSHGGDHSTNIEEVWFSGCHCGKGTPFLKAYIWLHRHRCGRGRGQKRDTQQSCTDTSPLDGPPMFPHQYRYSFPQGNVQRYWNGFRYPVSRR